MKKSLKIALIVFAVALGIVLLIGALLKLGKINKERKAEKLETSEAVYVRLDEAPQSFSSTKDSLAWALSVDEEIMLRYFSDLNPDKYHLKADSIAALLKSENLETSLLVLEKSRGVEKTAEFVYSRYRFDYHKNYELLEFMNAQDAVEEMSLRIDNWASKRYGLLGELYKICFEDLKSELDKLAEENNDILWLPDFISNDLFSELYSSFSEPLQLVSYACFKDRVATPSMIIDKINTEKLSEDYRLGKLLSPKRYEEVIAYLEEIHPIHALNYLIRSGADKDEFKKAFFDNLTKLYHDNIIFYHSTGMIDKNDIRKYLLSMTCKRLTTDTASFCGLSRFCKVYEIEDYEFIVLESIRSKHDVHLAEIFFNNHTNLYGDRKFLYKALEEKWESFK